MVKHYSEARASGALLLRCRSSRQRGAPTPLEKRIESPHQSTDEPTDVYRTTD